MHAESLMKTGPFVVKR